MDLRVEKTLQLYEAEIQALYGALGLSDDQYDDTELEVRRAFIRGVNSAVTDAVVEFLEAKYDSQQEMAIELGKRDRTSISKLKASKRIDGDTLSWILTRYTDFAMPSRRHRLAVGYAAATSRLRQLCGKCNGDSDETLTSEQFECLLGLFSNSEWLEAAARKNGEQKEEVEKQLLTRLKQDWTSPFPVKNVFGLMQIVQEWSRYFLICIHMIPVSEDE